MIDLHCHIDLYPNPGRIVAEAEKRQAFVLAVTTTPKAFLGNLRLAKDRRRIRVAVGLHPELVADRYREVDDVGKFMAQTKYVGEIGIDGSKDHASSVKLQTEVFSTIVKQAEGYGGRILSIHSRGAATKVLDVIESDLNKSLPVLHWFSGTKKELDRAIQLGCWFSVGPAMLRSRKGLDRLSSIPRSRILTETDGPFATDGNVPLMPWDVVSTLPIIADAWGCTLGDTDREIHRNLRELVSQIDGDRSS